MLDLQLRLHTRIAEPTSSQWQELQRVSLNVYNVHHAAGVANPVPKLLVLGSYPAVEMGDGEVNVRNDERQCATTSRNTKAQS